MQNMKQRFPFGSVALVTGVLMVLGGCAQASKMAQDTGLSAGFSKVSNGMSSFVPFGDSSETSSNKNSDKGLQRGELTFLEREPTDVDSIIDELRGGEKLDIEDLFEDEIEESDKGLYFLERGRLAQLQGSIDFSKKDYEGAIAVAKEQDEKAKISLSEAGANVAAILVNDNVIPYRAPGFERVMMYHFQAWNFLSKGDLSGAAVEVRRANHEQEEARKLHEKEIKKALTDADSKGVKFSDFLKDLAPVLKLIDPSASRVKDSFQNAYTFYVSGVVRELLDEPNDAYIDYKRALEIYPNNTFIANDVARLAKRLSMGDDLARLKKAYPSSFKGLSALDTSKNRSEVIVLFEDNLVSQKKAVSFPIPVANFGLTAVSVPVYSSDLVVPQPAKIDANGKNIGQTQLICMIDALAARSLKEQAPMLLTRQALRTLIKGAAASAASEKNGTLGVVVSVYNQLSEQADVRAWNTLPNNAQVFRSIVQSGKLDLNITHPEASGAASVSIDLPPGKKAIVRVVRIGGRISAQPIVF